MTTTSNMMPPAAARRTLANAIRALAMDAVEQAKSGHPGMPMGMADIAEVLWNDFLSHNPGNPRWVNRDRFVGPRTTPLLTRLATLLPLIYFPLGRLSRVKYSFVWISL